MFDTVSVIVAFADFVLCGSKSLIGGFAEPFQGFLVILLDTPSEIIAITQILLGIGIALVSGKPEQTHRLIVILGNAGTTPVA